MGMMRVSNSYIRGLLADAIGEHLRPLDLPAPSASFEDAARIGTTQVGAADLADQVRTAIAGAGQPGADEVTPALICSMFPEAWNEAVRASQVRAELLDWDDNGAKAGDCVFLFGFLDAPRAAAQREEV